MSTMQQTTPAFATTTREGDNRLPQLRPIDPEDRGVIADVRRKLAVDYAGARNAIQNNHALLLSTHLTDLERYHRVVGMMSALAHIDENLAIMQGFTKNMVTPEALRKVEKVAKKRVAAAESRAVEAENTVNALRQQAREQAAVRRSSVPREEHTRLQQNLAAAHEDTDRLRQELASARGEVTRLRQAQEDQADTARLRQELVTAQENAAHLQRELDVAKTAEEQCHRELVAAHDTGERLHQKLDAAIAERDAERQRIEELSAALSEAQELGAILADEAAAQAAPAVRVPDSEAQPEPEPEGHAPTGAGTPVPILFWTVDGAEVGTRLADRYGRVMVRPNESRITLTGDVDTSREYDTTPPRGVQVPITECGPFFPVDQ